MKNICIVNFNIYSLINPSSNAVMGGAELDMFVLARSLKEDYSVTILTGDWGQEKSFIYDGIEVRSAFKVEKTLANYIKAPIILFRALKNIDADVYITTSASPEVGLLAFFTKLYKKKLVYRTAHDIDCDYTYIEKNRVRGRLYKYGLENSDSIVVSVKKHCDSLEKYHKNIKNKISFIPLGIDVNVLPDKSQEKKYILWVARCETWKQPEIFLDLACRLPEFKFLMICPKQRHEISYFESIQKRAKQIPNLEFLDYVPFRDIQPYFDRAKIFINTSKFEGFTYTLIQSGLAGTPVVYLNVDPDGVIVRKNIGSFSNGNTLLMEKQVLSFMEDEKAWGEKSNNIHDYILREHSMKILKNQWNNLLNHI